MPELILCGMENYFLIQNKTKIDCLNYYKTKFLDINNGIYVNNHKFLKKIILFLRLN